MNKILFQGMFLIIGSIIISIINFFSHTFINILLAIFLLVFGIGWLRYGREK
jgi:uncharacterized membrane protein HdeD (DUF308 family)